jgi:uncharacterized membrane protein YhaH (DUF805 family)
MAHGANYTARMNGEGIMRRLAVAAIAVVISLGLLAMSMAGVTRLFAMAPLVSPGMQAMASIVASLVSMCVVLAIVFRRMRQRGEDA